MRADTLGHRRLYPALDTAHRVRPRTAPAGLNRSCYKMSLSPYLTTDTPSPGPIRRPTENFLVAQHRKSRMQRRVFGDTLNNDNGLRRRYHHQRHIESGRKDIPLGSSAFSRCRLTINCLTRALHTLPCNVGFGSSAAPQKLTSPTAAIGGEAVVQIALIPLPPTTANGRGCVKRALFLMSMGQRYTSSTNCLAH